MFSPKFQETRPVNVLKEVWSQLILFNGIPLKDTTNNFQRYIQCHESQMPLLHPCRSFSHLYIRRRWFFTISLAQDFRWRLSNFPHCLFKIAYALKCQIRTSTIPHAYWDINTLEIRSYSRKLN